MISISKKIVSVLIALPLLLALTLPLTVSAAVSSPAFSDRYDYFTDKYEKLTDTDHVYKTAEYYQFYNYFLGGTDLKALYGETANASVQPASGKYVFLLGGVWSAATRAAIGYVNEVAKEYGITAIYSFDPKLDGENLDISANAVYSAKYNAILTKLGVASLNFPSVIVYDKDSVTTGHVVSSYSWSDTSFSGQTAVNAFKSALRTNAFAPAAANGKITNISVSDSDYIRSVLNARYYSSYKSTDYRAVLRPLPENKDNVFEVVTLNELRGILASEGHYAVLLGGLWCHNTWAVVNLIEKYAEEYGIDKIYFYDTVLDSAGSSTNSADQLQTRSTAYKPDGASGVSTPSPIAHLYVDLVNDYIPNIYTLNQGEADGEVAAGAETPSASKFISYTDGTETVTGRRAQLPNFFVYNKNHKDAQGNAAPVIGQVEIMTELWNIDLASTGTNTNAYNAGGVYDNYTVGYNRMINNSYTYWAPGLNQVLGAFISNRLGMLISDAEALFASDYTAASFASFRTALQAAKTLKASVDAAVAAKSSTTLVPEGSAIINAYTALQQGVTSLVKITPATPTSGESQPTDTTAPDKNPETGETPESQAYFIFFAAALVSGAVTVLYSNKKKFVKNKKIL